jgi:uncharacterized protein YdiU (UPF0061 family)
MPTPLPAPYLVAVSPAAAALIGLEAAQLATEESLAILAGNAVPERAQPLAAVYSGHQFGVWATAAPSCLAKRPAPTAPSSCNGKAPA